MNSTAETLTSFQSMIEPGTRVGVTEFSRGKEWRKMLPSAGCFEVVDRNETVGFFLDPEFARSIGEQLAILEEQLENAQIEALYEARKNFGPFLKGKDLKDSALAILDAHKSEIMEFVNGD